MSRSLRNAAVAVAVGMTFGTSSVLADGYYAGSIKDAAPVPAPEIYQWDGLSVGVGVGVGRFDQDGSAKAWRKDEVDKFKKKCFRFGCKWKHKGGFDSAKGMHEQQAKMAGISLEQFKLAMINYWEIDFWSVHLQISISSRTRA